MSHGHADSGSPDRSRTSDSRIRRGVRAHSIAEATDLGHPREDRVIAGVLRAPEQRLYACGANHDGGLGTGDTRDRHRPTPIRFPSGVYPVQVAALLESGLAIGSDGRLYGWSYGYDGVLGDGDVTAHQVRTPRPVRAPTGVRFTAVSAPAGLGRRPPR